MVGNRLGSFIRPSVTFYLFIIQFECLMVTPRDRFNDPAVRDKVTRVVLLWVNNHFTDFETDPSMMEFLETFECLLEQSKMQSHVSLILHSKIFVRPIFD